MFLQQGNGSKGWFELFRGSAFQENPSNWELEMHNDLLCDASRPSTGKGYTKDQLSALLILIFILHR